MICVPFEPHHVDTLVIQPKQSIQSEWMQEDSLAYIALNPSYSLIDNDVTLGCAGFIPRWGKVAMCWAWVSDMGPKNFLRFHREVLDAVDYALLTMDRLEMYVDINFPEAHRWAKVLGFHCECDRMERFLSDGSDAALYVRLAEK